MKRHGRARFAATLAATLLAAIAPAFADVHAVVTRCDGAMGEARKRCLTGENTTPPGSDGPIYVAEATRSAASRR